MDDQPAADLKLLLERARHVRPACGHEDRIERRLLHEAARSVADANIDIVVAERGDASLRQLPQRRVALDREEPAGDLENGRAAWRERVWWYGENSVVGVSLNKKDAKKKNTRK